MDALYAEAMRLTTVDLRRAARAAVKVSKAAADGGERERGLAARLLGHVAFLRSRHREAVDRYEESIACFERAGLPLEAAITRNGAIAALTYLADYGRVAEWSASARDEFESRCDRTRLARLDGNLAMSLFRQDRFREAYELYERVHRELESAGRPVDVANALWNKATCLISMGEYIDAAAAYSAAREFADKHRMPVQAAAVDYNVAYLHFLCGDYTDAIRLYGIARKTGEPYRRALCDLDEAEMYLELNLNREAALMAGRARRRFQRLGMPYEQGKAAVFHALAEGQQGRVERALRGISSARRTFSRQDNRPWLALLDLYRAILLDRAGRYPAARLAANRAFSFFANSEFPAKAASCSLLLARLDVRQGRLQSGLDRCDAATGTPAVQGSPSLRYQAAHLRAELLEDMGRFAEARAAFQSALTLLESLRYRLRGDELKIAFLRDKHAVFDRLFWLTLTDSDLPDRVGGAFMVAELGKSRAMAEGIRGRGSSVPPEDAEIDRLGRDLDVIHRQLDRLEPAADPGALTRLRASASRMETALAGLIAARGALAAAGDPVPSNLAHPATLASWIPPGCCLIEYFVSRGTVFAFLAGAGPLRAWPLAPLSHVARTVRFLNMHLRMREPRPDIVHAHLRDLHRLLLEPLAPLLTGNRLLIVPHGVLHRVPFAALHDGSQALIDRFAISYGPSAELLRISANHLGGGTGSLVAGVPDESAPAIEEEVARLAALLPDAKALLGNEATLDRFSGEAPRVRYLHLAAHGTFRPDNPLFSAIRLADSSLRVFDLARLPLKASLVTLSGCGTGLSESGGGDELTGLVRGLFRAGAGAALLSLWDVHDRTAVHLMESFYRALLDGVGAPQALRQAALEVRAQAGSHYHWAAFSLIGMGADKKNSHPAISNPPPASP